MIWTVIYVCIILFTWLGYFKYHSVRHCPRQASQLSGTYPPDDFSCDAWRGQCLTGRRDRQNNLKSPHPLLAKEYKIELHIYHSGKRAQNRSRKEDFKKLEFRGYRISISLESMPLIGWTNGTRMQEHGAGARKSYIKLSKPIA